MLDVADAAQVAALPDAVGGASTRSSTTRASSSPARSRPSGRRPAAPARGQRRRAGRRHPGRAPAAARDERPRRVRRLDQRARRLAVPGRLQRVEVRAGGIADALRMELRPWDIRVVLVEPGSIDTDLWRGALTRRTRSRRACRASTARSTAARSPRCARRSRASSARPPRSDKVADTIEIALTTGRPRARYLVGADARVQLALRTALPTRAVDAAVARIATGAEAGARAAPREMAGPDRRRRSRSGQIRDALVWGAILGGAAGAIVGHAIDGVGAGLGALIGAVLYAPAEAYHHRHAQPGPAQAAVAADLRQRAASWRCSARCWASSSAPTSRCSPRS